MTIRSIDPATGEEFARFDEMDVDAVKAAVDAAEAAFRDWRDVSFEERGGILRRAADLLKAEEREHAERMAREMGKPVGEGVAEVQKCAWVCRYYAEHGPGFLADEPVETENAKSYVRYEALDAARAVAGKPPARHLTKVASLSRLSARRIQGGETPDEVLGDLMRQCTRVLNRGVNGWILTISDPSKPDFPKALIERDVVELAVDVSHYQAEGEPWASYVVLLVAAAPEGRGA